jgi:hypothetical protein
MAGYAPNRALAVISLAPGQYEPLGMDTIDLPKEAFAVPQLIIANGGDNINGTARPYFYFQKYRTQGAPLTFVIQNGTPHCCVNNMVPLILLWLDAVIHERDPSGQTAVRSIDQKRHWIGRQEVEDSGVQDDWKTKVWDVKSAVATPLQKRIIEEPARDILLSNVVDANVPPAGVLTPSWLPSHKFAQVWLAFEAAKEHPITPLE